MLRIILFENLRRYGSVTRQVMADRRGVTAIVTGIALAGLMGFAGLAIDVAVWLNASRGLQAAADQAAYSAAAAAGTNGCSSTTAAPQATTVAAARGYVNGQNNTTVTTTCTPSTSTFKVTISQVQPMWFAALFLSSAPTASASATAQLASAVSDLCVLALDGTNDSAGIVGSDADAGSLQGSTNLNLQCGFAVDSSSSTALQVGGGATMVATDVYLVGDDQGSPSGSSTLTTSPTPNNILRHQPPVEDPYLGRQIPPLGSCNFNNFSVTSGSATLNPGVYCNGLQLGSTAQGHNVNITINSGIYYVVGGYLQINANASVTANGVSFVLTGSNALCSSCSPLYARATINGGSSVSLTAPTSGTFGGIAIFQDRNAPFGSNSTCGNGQAQNKINGGTSQLITGALYFPNQSVCFTGNSSTSGAGKCTQLIGRTLDFTGNSSLALACAGTGITPLSVLTPQLIR